MLSALRSLQSSLHQNRVLCYRKYPNLFIAQLKIRLAPAHISGSRACHGLGSRGKCDFFQQAPTKTDLEISRTAERSQGFHDLCPHTPKLNTRNAQSRNRKNQTGLTRGTESDKQPCN